MHYFIFPIKDSYITENSPGHVILQLDSTDKNYGGDEILELKKEFVDSYSTKSYNVSRILTEFDYSNISSSIVNGDITSPRFYLRMYEVEGQSELDKTYTLSSHPLYRLSWDEGVGKHFDNPSTKNGVTWKNYSSNTVWTFGGSLGVTSGSRDTGGDSVIGGRGGGVWYTGSNASQSFINQSSDIEMDVTDIVNNHLDGTFLNYGIVTKFSGSYEDDVTPLNFKFFSRNTNTIYAPKLEVRWDDSVYFNGSSVPASVNYLDLSGEVENHIFIKGLQSTYRETEKPRFRIGCRKKHTQKTFTESMLTSSFYIPNGSGSYSIVDVATDTSKVPFSAYTSMSADNTSMYFDQWLNTFEPGRYYKILFKLKYNDGQEVIIDGNEEFKVI